MRLNDILKQMGFTKRSFSLYLINPRNFTVEDWIKLQNGKKEYQKKLVKMFGAEAQKLLEAEEKEKGSKVRKGKTLGSRKKWMPMR